MDDVKLLKWKPGEPPYENTLFASIGLPGDGVMFSLCLYRTCYRRGQHRLLVEVAHNSDAHRLWGCFDAADQPMRWYHTSAAAMAEAEAIARVLLADRLKMGPLPGQSQEGETSCTASASGSSPASA